MSSPYAVERSIPVTPRCQRSTISLIFDGRYLRGTGARISMAYSAVSGKPDQKAKFNYSRERQKIPRQGPIPEGTYWIQPSQMWENTWLKSVINASRSSWGNFRVTIHPYPDTVTHGRGGFFIHGGSVAGSAGCIDLTVHMDKFVEDLKSELKGLPECFIPLTVRYTEN